MIPDMQQAVDCLPYLDAAVRAAAAVKRVTSVDVDGRQSIPPNVLRELVGISLPDAETMEASVRNLQDFFGKVRRSVDVFDPECRHPGSQDGEDKIIEKLLPSSFGCYIDIGASEPRECSNTWNLYRHGWRGLLIEPLPWRTPALCLQRPGDVILPAAIMDYDGYVRLRVAGSCSSALSSWAIQEWGQILAPCFTLKTALLAYPSMYAADLVSVDVEGAEQFVFAGWPWDELKPAVICVEHVEYNPNQVGADLSGQWVHYLTDHGYVEHARTRFNIIYRRAA